MNDNETIAGDHLQAIDQALALLAPDLQHHIRAIHRRGPVTSGPPARGESPFHRYHVQMRAEDAAAILEVLETARERYGYQKRFGDRALGLLVGLWSAHVQRLHAAGPES